jgi:DUF1365 family protein
MNHPAASCLYECTVMHRRLHPKPHEFVYRIFLFHLDLDEIPSLTHAVPIFSAEEPNLYSLRNEDYFQFHSRGLRANLETFLQTQNITERPARIRLLTLPRMLGYTFNPISIFFCFDEENRPLTSVVQVGNTFGELKPYLVPLDESGNSFHIRVPKNYYVSPFSPLDVAFDFRFKNPEQSLHIAIDNYQGDQKTLISTLTGKRTELTTSNLARLTLAFPLVTLKIIFLIHWEALRLWLKGIPFIMKEDDIEKQTDAFRIRK